MDARSLAAEICSEPAKVCVVDTCALLDVIAGPTTHGIGSQSLEAATQIPAASTVGSRRLWLVVYELVRTEYRRNEANKFGTLEAELRTLREGVAHFRAANRVLNPLSTQIDGTIDVDGACTAVRRVLDQLLSSSVALDAEDGHLRAARARHDLRRAPAKVKGSFNDCQILEGCLTLARELRRQGFAGQIQFVSSNKRDFEDSGVGGLHPEIEADFDPLGVAFHRTIVQARAGADW